MSGDAHVRKRGADKRRKKVDDSTEDTVPLLIPAPSPTNEENIHVHKDAHLGGNFCSKIVFFGLFGTLAILVGLLIIEFHGSGDVESAADSPWSVMLEGWVDEAHDNHEHEEEHSVSDHSEEEESEHDVGFDLFGISESEHDDDEEEEHAEDEEEAGDSHETDQDDENEAESENQPESDAKSGDFGFYKSIYQSIYKTQGDDDAGVEENEPEEDRDAPGNDDDENDDDEDGGDDNDDDDDNNDNDDNNDDDDKNDDEQEDNEVDENDLFGEKDEDEYYRSNEAEKQDEASAEEEDDVNDAKEEEEEEEEEEDKFHKNKPQRHIDEADEKEDDSDDNEIIRQILARSQERKTRFEPQKDKPYETEAEEHIRNVMSGLRKKKLEEESIEAFDEEPTREVQGDQEENEETEENGKEEESVQEVIDDDDNEETVGVIVKFGVGVALIVVAHVVLIRKWNSWDPSAKVEDKGEAVDKSNVNDTSDTVEIIDRRESLVDLDTELPTPSGSEDEAMEDRTPEESEDEQVSENYAAKTAYEASATPADSEAESNAELTDDEVDDTPDRWKNEEADAQTGTEEEEEEEEEEDEEEEETEEEESPPPSPPKPKIQPEQNPRRRGGPRSADDIDFEQEYYEYTDITNDYDWAIRNELDFAEDEFLNGELGN
nr:PREDICTED: aspartic and glutamic acid-rich protein-like [Bemisia tabaci]